jgi:hypothetical protein
MNGLHELAQIERLFTQPGDSLAISLRERPEFARLHQRADDGRVLALTGRHDEKVEAAGQILGTSRCFRR